MRRKTVRNKAPALKKQGVSRGKPLEKSDVKSDLKPSDKLPLPTPPGIDNTADQKGATFLDVKQSFWELIISIITLLNNLIKDSAKWIRVGWSFSILFTLLFFLSLVQTDHQLAVHALAINLPEIFTAIHMAEVFEILTGLSISKEIKTITAKLHKGNINRFPPDDH